MDSEITSEKNSPVYYLYTWIVENKLYDESMKMTMIKLAWVCRHIVFKHNKNELNLHMSNFHFIQLKGIPKLIDLFNLLLLTSINSMGHQTEKKTVYLDFWPKSLGTMI